MISIAVRYIMCQKMLCQRLADVDLPPKVTYVYNPLEYAFETHYKFVKKYYNTHKRVLFLGMNPGPFGMSQNGVRHILFIN
jgi:single-strand selective monofunctional uracil DNA glycosylase